MSENSKEMKYKVESVLPYNQKDTKKEQITKMFNAISEQYDLMNRAMTMGVDLSWRRIAIDSLKPYKPQLILDVATGTGDFAIEAQKRLEAQKLIGVDLSEKMLEVGRIKVAKMGLSSKIELTQGDCMSLEYEDSVFDAVTVAFGVRNYESLEKGVKEMCRVLKPGGNLIILEMSEPYTWVKPFYKIYTKYVIPAIAKIYSKDKNAYNYLPNSIEAFPQGSEMIELLKYCGFSQVKYKRFTFGVCSFYRALK